MSTKTTVCKSHCTQRQQRSIWLTVIGCLLFIAILLGLFFHKITTPRYLSAIELRINGLVLLDQPQPLPVLQLPPGKWYVLLVYSGPCATDCIEHIRPLVSMLNYLQETYRQKTQLALIADNNQQLLELIDTISQQNIPVTAIDDLQPSLLEDEIAKHKIGHGTTAANQPQIAIIGDDGDYLGYFTAPFNHDKLLLTYSSVIEHR